MAEKTIMIVAYIVIGVLAGILGIVGLIIVLPWFKSEDEYVIINTNVIAPSEGNPHIALAHEHSMNFVNNSIDLIARRCKHEPRSNKKTNL